MSRSGKFIFPPYMKFGCHLEWYNEQTGKYSKTEPKKNSAGFYIGDDQNQEGYYRRGGSPRYPTQIEWLLSDSGGVKPYN